MRNEESAQLLLLRGVVEKELKEAVSEANENPKLTPEFLDTIELIEDGEFSDVETGGLKDLYAAAGRKKVKGLLRRARNKQERDLKENRMRDYFTAGDGVMFPILEDGLKFTGFEENEFVRRVSNGQETNVGRPDILGEDADGGKVKIELKARRYDPDKVSLQIARYLNNHKDSRLIFAAPEVDAKLFVGLEHYLEQGRIRFVEVREIGEDMYVFKQEVTPSDFENLPNRKEPVRLRVDDGLVDVMADVRGSNGRKYRVIKTAESVGSGDVGAGFGSASGEGDGGSGNGETEFGGGEEIEQGSFHDKNWREK